MPRGYPAIQRSAQRKIVSDPRNTPLELIRNFLAIKTPPVPLSN